MTQETPLSFLRRHLVWAATNPDDSAWHDFVSELGAMRSAARDMAGLSPLKLPLACIHCDGPLVRDRVDRHGRPYPDGLQDEVRCLTCDRRWEDHQHYQLVIRHRLQEADEREPDATMTLTEAREVWPGIDRRTWHSWIRRGDLVGTEGWFRVRDIREVIARRVSTDRPGRPVA